MSEPGETTEATDHNAVINVIRTVSLQVDQLSQLSRIRDVEEQRQVLLDCLQRCFDLASTRRRLAKHGPIVDPDCHAMIKAVEVAAKLTGCERAPSLPSGGGIAVTAFFASGDPE